MVARRTGRLHCFVRYPHSDVSWLVQLASTVAGVWQSVEVFGQGLVKGPQSFVSQLLDGVGGGAKPADSSVGCGQNAGEESGGGGGGGGEQPLCVGGGGSQGSVKPQSSVLPR